MHETDEEPLLSGSEDSRLWLGTNQTMEVVNSTYDLGSAEERTLREHLNYQTKDEVTERRLATDPRNLSEHRDRHCRYLAFYGYKLGGTQYAPLKKALPRPQDGCLRRVTTEICFCGLGSNDGARCSTRHTDVHCHYTRWYNEDRKVWSMKRICFCEDGENHSFVQQGTKTFTIGSSHESGCNVTADDLSGSSSSLALPHSSRQHESEQYSNPDSTLTSLEKALIDDAIELELVLSSCWQIESTRRSSLIQQTEASTADLIYPRRQASELKIPQFKKHNATTRRCQSKDPGMTDLYDTLRLTPDHIITPPNEQELSTPEWRAERSPAPQFSPTSANVCCWTIDSEYIHRGS